MKVYKFGGASVKDAEGVKKITQILKSENSKNCLLVISAMGKMTNAFEAIVHAYLYDKNELDIKLAFVKEFHQNLISELFEDSSIITNEVDDLFTELNKFLSENNSTDYDYVYDQIVCFGELLSTTIVSHYFNSQDLSNNWLDVRKLILTDATHRDAKVDWDNTEKAISETIQKETIHIVQGFLGGTKNRITTTLGREGSDYTAGIFAYCLDAENVTIWKDVQGVLNADPRTFSETTLLEEISYEETIEMAFYGASVIHPKTIQPLQSKEIPLYVKSFVNPDVSGTKISRGKALNPLVPCFIVKKNQILVSISTRDFSFIVEDNISDIFKLLHQHQLKVNLIQNSAISFSVCVDNKFNHFDTFYEKVKSLYKVHFTKDVDLYTIRHFTYQSIDKIQSRGTSILTQINKETAQIVIKKS